MQASAKMPNELECLAARLACGLTALAQDAHALIPPASPDEQPDNDIEELAYSVRAMQFEAMRLAALVQTHDATLRRLYTLSLYAVDSVRLATAARPNAQNDAVLQGTDAALETLADMQAAISALFPADDCISD